MKRDTISHTQLTALVWAGVLAPAAELLPAVTLPLAGKGAWLAPAAAIPLVLLGGWLLGSLSRGRGLAGSIREILGPVAGRGVLLIYMVWALVLLALRLRLCAQRLLSAGLRDGTMWFFLLAVAGMALWMGQGKLSAFARAGQLFLALLLATAGVVLALALVRARPELVLPLWREDVVPVLTSALPAAGALAWGLFGAFLTGSVSGSGKKGGWHWLFWGLGGCLLLTLAQWTILGNLGPALAGRLDNPFFALAKSVGVEGAFQRVESVVIALWTCADLTLCVLLLFALRAMAVELSPKIQEKPVAAGAALVGAAAALAAFSRGETEYWSRVIVPAGNLILALGLPVLLLLLKTLWQRGRKGDISCGESPP